MGTLSDCITRARIRARDTDKVVYSDADLINMINDGLQLIYDSLCQIESNLIYAETTVTTVADTIEVTPTFTHNGFLQDGVWIDGNTWYLKETFEADKINEGYDTTTAEPTEYFITEDGNIGFLPVPDDAYTVYIQYFKPITELSTATYTDGTSLNSAGNAADLPYLGMWDQTIQRMLIHDMLDTQNRPSSVQAIYADMYFKQSMNKTMQYGRRRRKTISEFFTIRGV